MPLRTPIKKSEKPTREQVTVLGTQAVASKKLQDRANSSKNVREQRDSREAERLAQTQRRAKVRDEAALQERLNLETPLQSGWKLAKNWQRVSEFLYDLIQKVHKIETGEVAYPGGAADLQVHIQNTSKGVADVLSDIENQLATLQNITLEELLASTNDSNTHLNKSKLRQSVTAFATHLSVFIKEMRTLTTMDNTYTPTTDNPVSVSEQGIQEVLGPLRRQVNLLTPQVSAAVNEEQIEALFIVHETREKLITLLIKCGTLVETLEGAAEVREQIALADKQMSRAIEAFGNDSCDDSLEIEDLLDQDDDSPQASFNHPDPDPVSQYQKYLQDRAAELANQWKMYQGYRTDFSFDRSFEDSERSHDNSAESSPFAAAPIAQLNDSQASAESSPFPAAAQATLNTPKASSTGSSPLAAITAGDPLGTPASDQSSPFPTATQPTLSTPEASSTGSSPLAAVTTDGSPTSNQSSPFPMTHHKSLDASSQASTPLAKVRPVNLDASPNSADSSPFPTTDDGALKTPIPTQSSTAKLSPSPFKRTPSGVNAFVEELSQEIRRQSSAQLPADATLQEKQKKFIACEQIAYEARRASSLLLDHTPETTKKTQLTELQTRLKGMMNVHLQLDTISEEEQNFDNNLRRIQEELETPCNDQRLPLINDELTALGSQLSKFKLLRNANEFLDSLPLLMHDILFDQKRKAQEAVKPTTNSEDAAVGTTPPPQKQTTSTGINPMTPQKPETVSVAVGSNLTAKQQAFLDAVHADDEMPIEIAAFLTTNHPYTRRALTYLVRTNNLPPASLTINETEEVLKNAVANSNLESALQALNDDDPETIDTAINLVLRIETEFQCYLAALRNWQTQEEARNTAINGNTDAVSNGDLAATKATGLPITPIKKPPTPPTRDKVDENGNPIPHRPESMAVPAQPLQTVSEPLSERHSNPPPKPPVGTTTPTAGTSSDQTETDTDETKKLKQKERESEDTIIVTPPTKNTLSAAGSWCAAGVAGAVICLPTTLTLWGMSNSGFVIETLTSLNDPLLISFAALTMAFVIMTATALLVGASKELNNSQRFSFCGLIEKKPLTTQDNKGAQL